MGRGVQRNQATSVDFFFFFLRPRNAAGEGGDDEKGQFLLSGSRIPLSLCSRGQAGPGGGLTAGPGSQTAGITAQLSASFPVEMQLGIQRRKPGGPGRSWRAGGTGSPTDRAHLSPARRSRPHSPGPRVPSRREELHRSRISETQVWWGPETDCRVPVEPLLQAQVWAWSCWRGVSCCWETLGPA